MPQTETKTGAGLNTIHSFFENFGEGVIMLPTAYNILKQNLMNNSGLPSINDYSPLGMALRFLRTGNIKLFYDLLRLEEGLVPQIAAALSASDYDQFSLVPLKNGSYYYQAASPITIKTRFGLLPNIPIVYPPLPPLDPTCSNYLDRPLYDESLLMDTSTSNTKFILLIVGVLFLVSSLSFIFFKNRNFFFNLLERLYPVVKNISIFKKKFVQKIEQAPQTPKNRFHVVTVAAGFFLTYSVYLFLTLIMKEEKVPAPVKVVLYPYWYTTRAVELCEAGEADPWWDSTCDTQDFCRRLPTHCLPPSDWR